MTLYDLIHNDFLVEFFFASNDFNVFFNRNRFNSNW